MGWDIDLIESYYDFALDKYKEKKIKIKSKNYYEISGKILYVFLFHYYSIVWLKMTKEALQEISAQYKKDITQVNELIEEISLNESISSEHKKNFKKWA